MENLQSIIYQRRYQEALKAQLEGALSALQSNAYATVSDYLTKCYNDGYVGTMYDLHGQGIPIVIPLLMNTPDGVLLKLLKNTVPILPQFFLTIWSKPFPVRSNVFRQTTGRNSPNDSVLMVVLKSLPFFRSGFQSTESDTS